MVSINFPLGGNLTFERGEREEQLVLFRFPGLKVDARVSALDIRNRSGEETYCEVSNLDLVISMEDMERFGLQIQDGEAWFRNPPGEEDNYDIPPSRWVYTAKAPGFSAWGHGMTWEKAAEFARQAQCHVAIRVNATGEYFSVQ